MSAILQVRGVRKAFRDVVAVDGVSFDLHEGEVFGLLGPNGAGKTTLIRMILDIYRPDVGDVAVFGHPLIRSDLDRIGYLPEERGLYQKRKVIQVLTYLGQLKGLSPKAATSSGERLLERLSIGEYRDKKLHELSKGNQQKIQLIGTLIAEPKLLVWDEPFSGLDPVNVNQVRELIASLRSTGTTMILSTHLMNQAEALCDRVGLIHHGRMALVGSVADVVESHGFLGLSVETDAPLSVGEDWPELASIDTEVTLADGQRRLGVSLCEGCSGEDLLRRILDGGSRVTAFHPVRPSLEEVFLRAVA
jgi:ABC-2 type transport system ATP-binding protein